MHSQSNPLKFRYFRSIGITFAALLLLSPFDSAKSGEPPPYAEHFNPANGFKPAQRNLTAVFLQMAGSLEHFGTPEPYMRHVLAEHARIDARYKKATGKDGSSRPGYFTEEYVQKLVKNWNNMAPALSLETFAKKSGQNMRYALMGSWNMTIGEKLAVEDKLSPAEAATYRKLLEKPWFEKRDFQTLEAFYGSGYDKLSELGKSQMSKRIKLGALTPEKRAAALENEKGGTMVVTLLNAHQKRTLAYLENKNIPKVNSDNLETDLVSKLGLKGNDVNLAKQDEFEHDALFYSHLIRAGMTKRIDAVRAQVKDPAQVKAVEESLTAIIGELAVLAQSEFEAAIYEEMLDR
jgi:hypothetical protein